jgi:poly(glycerol-phosphate) alpha-glucosyltransferase
MTDHCNLPEGFAADAALRIGTDTDSIAEGMRLLLRPPTSDLRPPISDLRSPTSDLRSPISDLRSLGENGRQLVSDRFTWPQVAAQMKEVYEWVLGGGNKPGCVW